jgi:hypothetical protein
MATPTASLNTPQAKDDLYNESTGFLGSRLNQHQKQTVATRAMAAR